MKIYQQVNSQGFHIGTSAHDDWSPDKGALDVPAPDYDRKTHRARWTGDGWDIRMSEEWEAALNPPELE